MPKTFSGDLRERVIGAVASGASRCEGWRQQESGCMRRGIRVASRLIAGAMSGAGRCCRKSRPQVPDTQQSNREGLLFESTLRQRGVF
jgi:hypothetical protein